MVNNLKRLKINKFRGIHKLAIDHISSVNVLVGENNSGKTSILEAIQLIANPLAQSEIRKLARQRERVQLGAYTINLNEAISWLFSKGNDKNLSSIEIEYKYKKMEQIIRLELEEEEFFVLSSQEGEEESGKLFLEESIEMKQIIHVSRRV